MEATRIKQPLQSKNNQLIFWTRGEEMIKRIRIEFSVKLLGETTPFKVLGEIHLFLIKSKFFLLKSSNRIYHE
jgi:hypothetical protein